MPWGAQNPFQRTSSSSYSRSGTTAGYSTSAGSRSPFAQRIGGGTTTSSTSAFGRSTSSNFDRDNTRRGDENNLIKITRSQEKDINEKGTYDAQELKDMKAQDDDNGK